MIPEHQRAKAQEIFNRGVIGTIAQGFVWQGTYRGSTHTAETPCACFYGHQEDPTGSMCTGGLPVAIYLNDQSTDLNNFRRRFSEFATEQGLDDSACWMEVEA